jgi:hypothetical protein
MLFSIAVDEYILREKIYLNGSIIRAFYGYISFLNNFSIFMVIIESSLLASLLTLSRIKDLAILQSIGGTYKQIQRIPLAEIFLITIIGNILGILEGIIGGGGLVFLLNLSMTEFNILKFTISVLILIVVSVIGSYLISSIFTGILLKKKFSEMLESQYQRKTLKSKKIWGLSVKNKLSFRLGYIFQRRSQIISFIMVFGILILTTLFSIGILGGSIIQNSTDSHMEKGYGLSRSQDNVIVVTSSLVISKYLQDLYDPQKSLQFNLPEIRSSENIPDLFFQQLPPNTVLESRLLFQGSIKMLGNFQVKNNEIVNIGNATFKSFFWCVDSSFGTIFDYHSYIDGPTLPYSDNIIIADGYQLFLKEKDVDSLIPKTINNYSLNVQRFNIARAVIDPFAKGFCTYMDISILSKLSIHLSGEGRNVVIIQNPSEIVYQLIQDYNLTYFSLNPFYSTYISNSNQFWFISNLTFIPVLFVLGLSMVAFSSIATLLFQKDLYVIKVLGGRAFTFKRIILWLNILVGVPGILTGIILGYSIVYSNLSNYNVQPSIFSWIILILSFLSIFLFIERYLGQYTQRIVKS